jgi:hypothetical protein
VADGGPPRAAKPPLHRNVFVRHPVVPFVPVSPAVRARLADLEPVVVVGRGHSGTRVVAWMTHLLGIDLGADERIAPSGDPVDRSLRHHLRIVAERAVERGPSDPPDRLAMIRFQRALAGHLRRRPRGAEPGRWGWKFPESYLTGPAIDATFPSARFVHLVRDGRDLAFKRHLTDVAEHRLARRILRAVDQLDAPHHLQAAASWAFQVERFASFAEGLPSDRLLTIRYEELVVEPGEQLERLATFLDTPITDDADRYATTMVSSRDLASHRTADPTALADVEALIGTTLALAGYGH